jgi:hypothetical protein
LGFGIDLLSVLDELGKIPAPVAKSGLLLSIGMTVALGIEHGKNLGNYTSGERAIAGADMVISLVGFAGLPGAGISIMYNVTKGAAPYGYYGIRAMNQSVLRPAYNYFDIIGAPKELYDIMGRF